MKQGRDRRRANRAEDESKRGPASSREAKDPLPVIRRLELACALALTALIVFLHVVRGIRAGALWRDEVSTVGAATMPSLSQVWSSLIYESFPALLYGIVRIWTGIRWLGGSDASLRVLGVSMGAAVLLVLWLNRGLLGYRVPLLSLALFGLNPTVIPWGDSLRGYGLGSLLILLVYGLLWKVVESPTPGRVVAAVLVSILSVQGVYQNAFLLLAICSGGFLVCLRRRMWKTMLVVLGIGAIAALSLIPYLPIITAARDVHRVADVSFNFSQILSVFATALSSNRGLLLWGWVLCGGICILALGYLLTVAPKDRGAERRLELAIFSATILGVGTVSFLLFLKTTGFLTQPWHYIVLMASIALSIDVLLEQATTTNPRRIGRLVVALAVAAMTFPIAWKQVSLRQTDIDIIASRLQERASQGDVVLVNPWYCGVTFQRYYRGQTSWITVPPIEQLALTRFDLMKEKMAAENPLQPVFDAMTKSLSLGNSVWVVGGLESVPQGQLPPSLPPAPNGPGGWYGGYYENAWTLQIAYFIQSHALEGEPVDLGMMQPVSPYENVPLQVFKGWRP